LMINNPAGGLSFDGGSCIGVFNVLAPIDAIYFN
jgi:hypothetical protein